ncbi:hypothetical+protein [Methylocapsa aurea]|uniref:hypothetical protein n=1 Tax=Methylocapsa aurea TaxID=663610 RepID=UPI003D18ACFE
MTTRPSLPRILAARALLWLARRVDLPAPRVGERADRPATLRELALLLARVKFARWRLYLARISS